MQVQVQVKLFETFNLSYHFRIFHFGPCSFDTIHCNQVYETIENQGVGFLPPIYPLPRNIQNDWLYLEISNLQMIDYLSTTKEF